MRGAVLYIEKGVQRGCSSYPEVCVVASCYDAFTCCSKMWHLHVNALEALGLPLRANTLFRALEFAKDKESKPLCRVVDSEAWLDSCGISYERT